MITLFALLAIVLFIFITKTQFFKKTKDYNNKFMAQLAMVILVGIITMNTLFLGNETSFNNETSNQERRRFILKRFIILFIPLLLLVGCGQEDVVNFDEDSTLVIEGLINSKSAADYELIDEINEKETVQKVVGIFIEAKWDKNIEVQMEREPDFKLNNSYHIWVTPHGDLLEVINTNNSYYTRLSKSDSSGLYKIMTGKELD